MRLSQEFGWTPDDISQLTPAQILAYFSILNDQDERKQIKSLKQASNYYRQKRKDKKAG